MSSPNFSFKNRQNLGRVAKLCEENYTEIEFDDKGNFKSAKGYTTPKNMRGS